VVFDGLKFALRQLRRSPGFALASVLTLGLGIGANTAIFSLVHAILLKELPFPDAARVVTLKEGLCGLGICAGQSKNAAADFHAQEGSIHSFRWVAEYVGRSANLSGDGISSQRLAVTEVTAHFLNALGVKPALGRGFASDEDVPGKDAVALISYRLWQDTFRGDEGILGRDIALNAHRFKVIGVLPREMDFPAQSAVWTPTIFDSNLALREEGGFFTPALACLNDGVSMKQAQAELAALYRANAKGNVEDQPVLTSIAAELTEKIRPALLMLMGAVSLVVLIACANVAGLMLVRTAGRRTELAVRAALGASRGWLMRQQLVESVAIALCGGVCGVACAQGLLHLLYAMRPADLLGFPQPAMSMPVLIYTAAVSVATGLLFGMAPAWFAGRQDPGEALQSGQWRSSAAGSRLQRVLVCGEVALAVVLLAGAGLLMRTMQKIGAQPLGFSTDHRLTFSVILHGAPYETKETTNSEAIGAFRTAVMDGLRGLPGVVSVAAVNGIPLRQATEMLLPAKTNDGKVISALPRVATQGYFATMGIPLLEGQDLADGYSSGSPKAAVVTRDLADKLWPGKEPVGQQLQCPWYCGHGATVIGVIAAQRNFGARVNSYPAFYVAYSQTEDAAMTFVMRTTQDPRSLMSVVRDVVAKVDSSQPVFHLQTMHELSDDRESLVRMESFALSVFGCAAVALAAIGIYGTISYSIARRTREIGLRMALGAGRVDVARAVMIDSARITLIGSTLGLAGALGLGHLLKSAVFGISEHDPSTLLAVFVIFFGVAAIAALIPTRKAASVDPAEALRSE
jgi:putative ABC transport system permease protein